MTSMTTSQLTVSAARHIVRAIRDGLGVNAMNAKRIFDFDLYHLTFVEPGAEAYVFTFG